MNLRVRTTMPLPRVEFGGLPPWTWLGLGAALLLSNCAAVNRYESATVEERAQFRPVKVPLPPGTRYKITQGAFNKHSRSTPGEEYGWDIGVPPKTVVTALTDGTVEQLQDSPLPGSCDARMCPSASWVRIKHRDGTLALYKHVKPQVLRGQKVQEGQRIGFTDQSGCVCENKFSITVYENEHSLPGSNQVKTVPLYFIDAPGGLLRENEFGQTPWPKRHY